MNEEALSDSKSTDCLGHFESMVKQEKRTRKLIRKLSETGEVMQAKRLSCYLTKKESANRLCKENMDIGRKKK